MMIRRMKILSKWIRMFPRRIVSAYFLKVMVPINGIGIWEITDGNLQVIPISMRYLATKLSFMPLMEILVILIM